MEIQLSPHNADSEENSHEGENPTIPAEQHSLNEEEYKKIQHEPENHNLDLSKEPKQNHRATFSVCHS